MGRGLVDGRRLEWEERVRRYVESGLSVVEFCEWEGVSTATFYNWRKKLTGDHSRRRRRRSTGTARSGSGSEVALDRNSFVPVRVTSPFTVPTHFSEATSNFAGAPSRFAGAAPNFSDAARDVGGAAESSRIEILLANGVRLFLADADAGAIETVIRAVGRLSDVSACDAGELDDREEDIAC